MVENFQQKFYDSIGLYKSRNPRLFIVNYFDTVINQIDLNAEVTLNSLSKVTTSRLGEENLDAEINKLRLEFIDEVKKAETAALINCDQNLKSSLSYYEQAEELAGGESVAPVAGSSPPRINTRLVNINNKLLDQTVKLFSNFFVIIDRASLTPKYTAKYKLGLMIILDWFMQESEFKIFNKALLKSQIIKNLSQLDESGGTFTTLNNGLIQAEFVKEKIKESGDESSNGVLRISQDDVKLLKRLDLTAYQINRIEANTLSQYKQLAQLFMKIGDLNELISNFSFVNLNNINLEELYLRYYSDQDTLDLNLISGLKNLKNLKILNEYQGSSNRLTTTTVVDCFSLPVKLGNVRNLTRLETLFISDTLVESLRININLISGLKNLKRLSMLNTDRFYSFIDNKNNITSLVNNNNFLCGLTNLEELTLQYTKIDYISQNNFMQNYRHLRKLSLCQNEIEHLEAFVFQNLSHLEELDLNFNLIRALVNNQFSNMRRLKTLKLFNNKIESIESYALTDLVQLVKLDLGINAISLADRFKIFDKQFNLKVLCLSQNNIELIDECLFENLVNLEELDMHSNQIKVIREHQFRCLTRLKCLNLNDNKIQRLEVGCMNNLLQLEWLNLNNNALEQVPNGLFSSLPRLKVLSLSENIINRIGEQAFAGMESLVKLDLSGNKIDRVTRPVFSHDSLKKLCILNLSMNQINHIDENAFAGLSSLSKLILYGNSVNLDETREFYRQLINLDEEDDEDDDDEEDGMIRFETEEESNSEEDD